jgi:putative MFS transporter
MSVSEALDQIGWGRFQRKLMWICGASWAADAMEVLLIGFAIPSLIEDWGISKSQGGQLASVLFLGMLIGAWGWGMLSDYVGRKFGFVATIAIDSVFGLLSAFSPNFAVLLILRFLTGLGVGGTLPVDYALFGEYLPTKNRGRYLVYLESFWALGTILAAGLAWMIIPQLPQTGWRYLLAASAVPGLMVIWIRRSVPESPRYLMVQGKEVEARRILLEVAKENHIEIQINKISAEPMQKQIPLKTIFQGQFLGQTIMVTLTWFLISLGYYGLFVWLPGIFRAQGFTYLATYQATFMLALAQLPGYFSAAWFVEKLGRVRTLGLYLTGAAVATYIFAVTTNLAGILSASILMSFFALGAWGALYAYTPELYPTSARGTGMGWAGGVARVAGVLAPMLGARLLDVNLVLALTVYAFTFLLAGGVVLSMGRETKNKPLADTVR